MAIMDKYLEFCDGTSIPTAIGTTTFGNQVELAKAANPNSGKGEPIYLHVKVGTVFSAATSTATIAFNLQHAGTNSAASYSTVHPIKVATVVGTYAAGYEMITTLPSITLKRFLRLSATIAGSAFTGGTVDAWLNIDDAAR